METPGTLTVSESLLYYLLGYVVLEEKRKLGFRLPETWLEDEFRLFLGYTTYNLFLFPNMIRNESGSPLVNSSDVD